MTIKVVQGLIGKLQAEASLQSSTAKASSNSAVQSSSIATSVVRDAVVVNFSSARSAKPVTEKIGEYKEAKKVASDTADRIKEDPEKALDAQGELDSPKSTGKALL